jgi:hypothetical protein
MSSDQRTFRFQFHGETSFAMATGSERVSLHVNSHDSETTLYMSAAEARAVSAALEAAATCAENVLTTGLGESAVEAPAESP